MQQMMSTANYFKIKDRLVPKHLGINQYERKRQMTRKMMLMESPTETIQKAKLKYLKPINEIQTIMKHFDHKFKNKAFSSKPLKTHSKRKQRQSEQQDDGNQLQEKMKYLLSLPTLKNIQEKAQRYREQINSEEIKRKETAKQKILDNFEEYIKNQMRANPSAIKRRMATLQ